jgi:hypothetical protein
MVSPGHGPLQRNKDTYRDLPYLSFFCSFSPRKVEACVLVRLSEGRLEAAVVVWHRMSAVF